jgi:hypothetical protein
MKGRKKIEGTGIGGGERRQNSEAIRKTFLIVILRSLSPRASYTDRASVACKRS